jgi:hypothetical protein
MALLLDYNLVKFANCGATVDDIIDYFVETPTTDIVEEYFNNDFIDLQESLSENYYTLLEELDYVCENRLNLNVLKSLYKFVVGGSKGGPNIFQRSVNSLKKVFQKVKGSRKSSGAKKVNIPPPQNPPNTNAQARRTPRPSRSQAAKTRAQRIKYMRQKTASTRKNTKPDPNNKKDYDGLRKRDLLKLAGVGAVTYSVLKGAGDIKNTAKVRGEAGVQDPPSTTDIYNPPSPRPGIDTPSGSSEISSRGTQAPSRSASSTSSTVAPSRPLPPSLPSSSSDSKKGEDLKKWEKANKILAIAAAEKQRIRGTSQTDNPLMKDLRSRLPEPKQEYQAPEVASLGKGNQSLTSNKYAKKEKSMKEELQVSKNDAYLIVSDYLLKNGHADSVEESYYVASGMDVNTVMDIVESYYEAASLMAESDENEGG